MHARDAAFWVLCVSLLISVGAQPGLNGDAASALAPDSPATLPPGHGRPEDVHTIGEVTVTRRFCLSVSICVPLGASQQHQDGHQQAIFASPQRQTGCRRCCLQPRILRLLLCNQVPCCKEWAATSSGVRLWGWRMSCKTSSWPRLLKIHPDPP